MREYNLGFISDEDIFEHVRSTVEQYRKSIDLAQFNKNIIDPIKLTFDAKVYRKTYEEIIETECVRQMDKSNSNHIGYFHQNLFKYVGNGWEVPKEGFDLVNEEKHIFVEIKNKHNTMNSGSAANVYIKMQSKLLEDDRATCYLVEAISGRSKDEPWNRGGTSHKLIRKISIDQFYELALNCENGFYNLCNTLPKILDDVLNEYDEFKIENTVLEELQEYSQDTFKSLFLLGFGDYNGFRDEQ